LALEFGSNKERTGCKDLRKHAATDYCDCLNGIEGITASDLENEAMAEVVFESVSAIVNSLMDTEKVFLQTNFRRLTGFEGARNRLDEIVPYAFAGALLSLSCKEINEESITALLSGVGIKPDPESISVITRTWSKNHILYIYAYYFLLALGKDSIDSGDLIKVVKSLGNDTNENTAGEALAFVSARERASKAVSFLKNRNPE
jgi:ribosomal protein L12E/L44/L45/RPP1/RPP2